MIIRKEPKKPFDLKSHNFHNRMVNDLRKYTQEPTSAWKAEQKHKDELLTIFTSLTYNLKDKQPVIDYIKSQKEYHKEVVLKKKIVSY
jgi:hypothetical protein